MNVIHDHDLAPLVGKHHHHHSNAEDVVWKRTYVEYDHKRAEMSILSDWVDDIPQFVYKQQAIRENFQDQATHGGHHHKQFGSL